MHPTKPYIYQPKEQSHWEIPHKNVSSKSVIIYPIYIYIYIDKPRIKPLTIIKTISKFIHTTKREQEEEEEDLLILWSVVVDFISSKTFIIMVVGDHQHH